MVTHVTYDPELTAEFIAGVRAHWDGLFVIGAPDVKVVNVTKDAIWVRDASLVGLANLKKPKPTDALALAGDISRGAGQFILPEVKIPREQQQGEYIRKMEIDPAKYYPADVNRALVLRMPSMKEILKAKAKSKFSKDD